MLFVLLAIDILGSVLGIFATGTKRVHPKFASVTSGIFCGVALVWMLPEMGQISGWPYAWVAVGGCLGLLFLVDRFVCPVCPCCTHVHPHSLGHETSSRLLLPLVAGICLHNFLDGWSTQLASATAGRLGIGLLTGNLVHKGPESVVFGLLLRSGTGDSRKAVWLSAFASVFLAAGSAAQAYAASFHSGGLFMVSLSLAAAGFLFIGVHSFRAECAQNGRRAAVWSLATGFAATAVVELAVVFLTTP